MSLPSLYLPSLHPPPLPTELLTLLTRLTTELLPSHTTVDLRSWAIPAPAPAAIDGRNDDDGADDSVETDEEVDGFEREFARGWLNRVVIAATRRAAMGEGEEGWEAVVDRAAGLISGLAGDCCKLLNAVNGILPPANIVGQVLNAACLLTLAGLPLAASAGSTTTYLLPHPQSTSPPHIDTLSSAYPTPPPTRLASPLPLPPLSITIRSTTLLASSTGFRTWSSASILAAALAADPARFFPWLAKPGGTDVSRVKTGGLRVLELGAGTGLVGLAAAASLVAASSPSVTIDSTDFEAPVLDNLRHNVDGNPLPVISLDTVDRRVSRLDWREVAAAWTPTSSPPQSERYDLLLAADVIYEPLHLTWLHPTISSLLRFPTANSPPPSLWLLLPLRPTHSLETRAVARAFSRAPRAAEGEGSDVGEELRGRWTKDGEGRRWVLRMGERGEVRARDGFSAMGNAGGVRLHWMCRIEWVPLEEDMNA